MYLLCPKVNFIIMLTVLRELLYKMQSNIPPFNKLDTIRHYTFFTFSNLSILKFNPYFYVNNIIIYWYYCAAVLMMKLFYFINLFCIKYLPIPIYFKSCDDFIGLIQNHLYFIFMNYYLYSIIYGSKYNYLPFKNPFLI